MKKYKHAMLCEDEEKMIFESVPLLSLQESKLLEYAGVPVDTDVLCFKIENDPDMIFEDLLLVRERDFEKFKKEYLKRLEKCPRLIVRYVTRLYTQKYKERKPFDKDMNIRKYLI